jgi:hypothetical protein
MTSMDALIRRAAGVTQPSSKREADTDDDDLGEHTTPDADQGQHTVHANTTTSMEMNDRIRRAAGISVRPGHRPVPEIGRY